MKIYLRDIKERFPEFEIRNYDDNAYFVGFNHDSRTIKSNEIFIPIVGDNFDGHDFILQALKDGASMSICESKKSLLVKDATKPVILVYTIKEGLQKILNHSLSSINAPIVGITGSAGKTTTRKMLTTILSGEGEVLSTEGNNINTVWGNAVLLSQYTDEKYIVLECGMDHAGEIAWHMNSVDPDLGILLNVGYVHAENLGSIEKVYEEKKNMADYLNKTGKPLVLNIDDDRLVRIAKTYTAKLITFGKKENSDYKIFESNMRRDGLFVKFSFQGQVYEFGINAFGEGLAYNAVAAIAAAHELGMSLEKCVSNIKRFVPEKGRFEIVDLNNAGVIVNDAYNANPISMDMSLKTFNKLFPKDEYHRIVVLGDMKELGDVASEKHMELGKLVKELEFNETYYIGDYFNDFNFGTEVKSIDEIVTLLKEQMSHVTQKVAILCKGSHSTGLYQIPEFVNPLCSQ
ncbi:UDP-N-acetylmuramoyl-tripeptide--D-alanyl-D-alanine ligase [Patescibacteria group bacterium]|nr:UDP-N-acetylmuramoyl-tripeptide--D-alanyl-D-alanine ligase [Patescibacteria group bacterium]